MAGGRRRPTDRGIGDDSGCHGFCYRSVVCGFSCRLHLIWPHLDPLGTLILDGNMVLLRMRRRKRKAPKEVLLKMKDNLGGCPVTKKRRLVVKEDEHIVFRTSDDDDDERRYVDYKWKAKEGAISHGVEPSLIAIRSSGFGDPGWEHGIAQDEKKKKVITANTDCFRAAGKLLEEKRKCLFWTPCVAYCTNTILEDILKIKWIEEKGASWTSSYKLPEVIRGLNECITRLELDDGTRVCAVTRVPIHGISCLELQRIAVRILSQTCMSFGCEHRWSALDHLPYSRKKRMDQSRFNDVAFVHYNLRLRERQMKRVDSNTSLDNFFVESLLGGWVKAPENAALTTDEVIQQNGDDQDVNGLEYFDKGKDSIILTENVETSEVQPGSGVAIKEVDDDADVDQLF
ncbi:hypothetical protein HPP92_017305 [Vanilla planifolia]|uniref:DUF659 domain-containing protein n=1 Tax=Vanilla planifolia TaxID=51239 RepID=A0A835US40_VANPL|nr:hypothetical protein HPP92_017305 [Vanilla planifolia]